MVVKVVPRLFWLNFAEYDLEKVVLYLESLFLILIFFTDAQSSKTIECVSMLI